MMKIYDKKLAYPYFVWMVLFTVVPLFIVVYYALTDSTGSFTLDNLVTVSGYGSVFARSLLLALISTVICLIIAFPVGYFLSRLRVNKQHIMLMLVMLPMWMNFLLRTYAWMGLLSINGPVSAVLGVFGLGPYNMLNTSGAVVLGMVYPATLENGAAGKKRSSELTKEYQRRYTARFHKLDCRDLLAEKDLDATDMARELGVTQHCRVLVVSGVELLCEMLEELA